MRLDATSTPIPWPSLAVEHLDGELAVLDQVSGRAHHLNPSAAAVWSLLDGSTSLGDIGTALAEATGAPSGTVIDDVVALARDLDARGLLAGDVDQAAVEPPGP